MPSIANKPTTMDAAITNWDVNTVLDSRLQRLKVSLLNVQPTSTDCERAFSAAGLVFTPLRTIMKEDLLDAILFLKNYYN